MPNWCESDLYIKGDKGEIIRFKEFARDGSNLLSCDKFIPYPQPYKEMDAQKRKMDELAFEDKIDKIEAQEFKDGFNNGGYEWCITNWGTKWDFVDPRIVEEGANNIKYSTSTAWSPALPVIKKMSNFFLSLLFTLKYFERGQAFQGIFVCKKGIVKKNWTGSYKGLRGG